MYIAGNSIAWYARFILAFVVIFSQLIIPDAYPFGEEIFDKLKGSDQPVIVKGDKVEYFQDQKKVVGDGNVSISYGDINLSCDKIIVYTDTKEAICEGNVVISQPGASMEGEKINYNFAEKKGYAIDSTIKAKPFYGGAKALEQTGAKAFDIKDGYITTCDLENPHYRIVAKEIQIFLDEKILAKNIVFYIGEVPVFFMPLYVQPLNLKFPEVTVVPGRTGDWGYYALTAWRYFFNENSKGFVNLDYREKKGLASGIDYQYKTKDLGKGIARFYYAHENDALTINKSGPVDNRWRVQYRHSLDLPEDTAFTMEFNKLSDRNVIKDYLYREFEEEPSPDNYILFKTSKPNFVLTLLGRARFNDFLTVVEKLPEFTLDVNNQRLWNTNFYYNSTQSIINFSKKYDKDLDQADENSLRIDDYNKFSYAAKLFRFLYVTPSIATRQTYYSQDRWKNPKFRSIYETAVEISTRFYRVFNIESDLFGLNLRDLRHIVSPKVEYLNRPQPTVNSGKLYYFDDIDEIERYNGFKLSLENKIQTKRPSGDGMATVDLARLMVSTDYTFTLKKNPFQSKGDGKFGDVTFDLDFYPYTWLSVNGNLTLNNKDLDISTANVDVNFNMGKKLTLGMGHRYEKTDTETTSQLTGELFYNINDDWKIKIYERYDFAGQKLEEQEYTLYKDLHCWEAELSLDIRDGDYTAWMIFKLKAFPEVPIGLFKTTYRRPEPGARQ
ncbi:MAG: LPS assembly protein LptD [Candidatus Omnitrophota bacterium]